MTAPVPPGEECRGLRRLGVAMWRAEDGKALRLARPGGVQRVPAEHGRDDCIHGMVDH